MKTVILLQCCKSKLSHRDTVVNIYISPLYKKSLKYAQILDRQAIHVLSAKHGLLDLDTIIDPYNVSLHLMTIKQRKIWAEDVLSSLNKKYDLEKDKFIFLTGHLYREFLTPSMTYYEIPLQGLSIGRVFQRLNKMILNDKKGFGFL